MPGPLVTAALISGGASVLGGLLSNRSSRNQFSENAALQREFAQQGIRWKVADAKAAGLHPLYAIGATGASYSPTTYPDALGPAIGQAGRDYGNAVAGQHRENTRRRESSRQRQIQQDQIILGQQRLRSQIHVDTAQANYYDAMAEAARRQPDSGLGGGVVNSETAETGQSIVKPAEITAAKKGDAAQAAGPDRPAWMDVRVGNVPGLPVELQTLRVPQTEESWGEEFLEKLPLIAAANAARYYRWLTTDDIAAMYMSPYGRVKLLNMARKNAPRMMARITKALYERFGSGGIARKKMQEPPQGLQYGP